VIVDDPRAHPEPSISTLQKYGNERNEAINLRISLVEAKEAKEATSGRATSEEAFLKRKARERKALEKAKAAAAPTDSSDLLFTPESCASASEPPVTKSSPAPAVPAYTVTVPATSSSLPWYAPHKTTYTTLAGARTEGVWIYPSTPHERAKCGVFRELWQQGYFMGGGIKFGGDYLIYPGWFLLAPSLAYLITLICGTWQVTLCDTTHTSLQA
jgi:tRNA-splicing endonuclease subunit Sen34